MDPYPFLQLPEVNFRTRAPMDDEGVTLYKPSADPFRKPTPNEILNYRDSYLHKVPYELVAPILKLLPPVSLASLRKTCRMFYHDYPQTYQVKLSGHERIELFHLLDRDGNGKLVCSECKVMHNESDFFPMDVQKTPDTRQCKRTRSLLRVCPFLDLSFVDLQKIKESGLSEEPRLLCPYKGCYAWATLEPATAGHPNGPRLLIGTSIRVSSEYVDLTSVEKMKARLESYDLLLCPHRQINEDSIFASYVTWLGRNPNVLPRQDFFRCEGHACEFCGSRYRFSWKLVHDTGIRAIYLDTFKILTIQDDVDDPQWLSQLSVVKTPDMQFIWAQQIMELLTDFITDISENLFMYKFANDHPEVVKHKVWETLKIVVDMTITRFKILGLKGGLRSVDAAVMMELSKPLWKKPSSVWIRGW